MKGAFMWFVVFIVVCLVAVVWATVPEPPKTDMELLFRAICIVESNDNSDAYNKTENAVGCAQIRPIMVEDVNRISGKRFRHFNAYERDKSYEMFCIFQNHYNKGKSMSQMARCWNGGPNGHKKTATLAYWNKVKDVLAALKAMEGRA